MTPHPGRPAARPLRRRGTMYIAVLSVAMLVSIIGLTAFLATRVALRAAVATDSAVRADVLAQSMVEAALHRVVNNANWRTTYTNDTWTAGQTVAGATVSFKLVDELDGNLANDANQPARLYGRAQIGDAQRIYSVRLDARSPQNLLINGNMEAGLTGWSGYDCTLESRTDSPHADLRCTYAKSRASVNGGPMQTITSTIKNGVTYNIEVWAKMDTGSRNIRFQIQTVSSAGGTQSFTSSSTLVTTSWTRVSGSITPSWSGTLTSATLTFYALGATTAFRFDDAVMTEAGAAAPMVPAPGTWRREVLTGSFLPDPNGAMVYDPNGGIMPL